VRAAEVEAAEVVVAQDEMVSEAGSVEVDKVIRPTNDFN